MNNKHQSPLGSKGIVNNEVTGKVFFKELAEKVDSVDK